jgi:hypothetical protein
MGSQHINMHLLPTQERVLLHMLVRELPSGKAMQDMHETNSKCAFPADQEDSEGARTSQE